MLFFCFHVRSQHTTNPLNKKLGTHVHDADRRIGSTRRWVTDSYTSTTMAQSTRHVNGVILVAQQKNPLLPKTHHPCHGTETVQVTNLSTLQTCCWRARWRTHGNCVLWRENLTSSRTPCWPNVTRLPERPANLLQTEDRPYNVPVPAHLAPPIFPPSVWVCRVGDIIKFHSLNFPFRASVVPPKSGAKNGWLPESVEATGTTDNTGDGNDVHDRIVLAPATADGWWRSLTRECNRYPVFARW